MTTIFVIIDVTYLTM